MDSIWHPACPRSWVRRPTRTRNVGNDGTRGAALADPWPHGHAWRRERTPGIRRVPRPQAHPTNDQDGTDEADGRWSAVVRAERRERRLCIPLAPAADGHAEKGRERRNQRRGVARSWPYVHAERR